MTNKQILKKAIEKAVKNGWDITKFYPLYYIDSENDKPFPVDGLLTNHDFAKAIWREEGIIHYFDEQKERVISGNNYPGGDIYWWTIPEWQHHLQQMVLEKEPLKYLEKFLDK